jgi:glycosyltransferase involved in cell wall biosynthesis
MKILFVVHRAHPYQGGSEVFVHAMATEAVSRCHQVAVFAGEHLGDQDGVRITSDPNIFSNRWDLVLVHGTDVNWQHNVLIQTHKLPYPVVYMVIKPGTSDSCRIAANNAKYISYSTNEDIEFIKSQGMWHKAVPIRHSVTPEASIGKPGFKTKYGIEGKMFLSCGGYWPNKALPDLANVFEHNAPDGSVLVLTGYDNRYNLMPARTNKVIPLMIEEKNDVMNAMSESEALIMHSYSEGFGLVLLEAMVNKTPWIGRNIAGARILPHGKTYSTNEELIKILGSFNRSDFNLEDSFTYVMNNHTIRHTVDDIENILRK